MLDGEAQLIRQAQRGNAESFGELYDHYLPKIYRYIFAKVSHREYAEDIAHEVFLAAWKNLPGYRMRGFPFSSWLYRIARNEVIEYYRLEKHHVSVDELDPDVVHLTPAVHDELDRALAWNAVRNAMDHLTNQERDVLILRFVNDLTPKEVAAVLGKSEGAIRVMQHRALKELKQRFAHTP